MPEIEIKIPADDKYKSLAAAIGLALYNWGNGNEASAPITITSTTTESVGDVAVVEQTKVTTTADIVKSIKADNVVKLNSAEGASDSTLNTDQQLQEQSNATEGADVGGASDATVASGQPVGNDLNNLDTKGVGKHADYCGNAKVPFNATGKKKGQWKKRQGVTEEAYDEWYALSLAAIGSGSGEQKPEINTDNAFNGNGDQDRSPEINTDAAFGQQQQSAVNGQVLNNGQSQQKKVEGGRTFVDAGEYMKWQAEQQAAGNITNGDIESGYAANSIGIQDLFDPAKASNAVAVMYNYLAPIAGEI